MSQSPLQQRLEQLKAITRAKTPTPKMAVRIRTISRLRREGYQTRCTQIGETVPDFQFIDTNNDTQTLYDILEKGPVVLNFFRGFWCAYCRAEIEAYGCIQTELQKLGYSYFAISPQRPETASKLPDNYQVIFDHNNNIARDFGLVYSFGQAEDELFLEKDINLSHVNAIDSGELPVPATFIVRQDRTIGYVFIDVDFRERCSPEELIRELNHL